MRRPFRLVAALLAATLLAGCWDAREIDDRTLVMGLALDVADGGGPAGGQLELTAQIAVPRAIAGGGAAGGEGGGAGGGAAGGGRMPTWLLRGRGRTVQDALRALQAQAEFRLFFGHLQVIVLGRELARRGVREELKALLQDPEVRRLTPLVVSDGRGADLLAAQVPTEDIPAVALNRFVDEQFRLARAPIPDLGRFMVDVSTPGIDPLVTILQPRPMGFRMEGTALFRADRMVGHVGQEDSWYLLWMRRIRRGPVLSIPVPVGGGRLWVDTFHIEAELLPRRPPPDPEVELRLDVEMRVVEAPPGFDLTDERELAAIERQALRYFRHRLQDVLARLRQTGADPVGLGRELLVHFPHTDPADADTAIERARVDMWLRVSVRRTTLISR